MLKKIKTALDLLVDPDKRPFLVRKLKQLAGKPHPDWNLTSHEAEQLCRRRALSPQAAFGQLFNSAWVSFTSNEAALIMGAQQRVAKARKEGSVMGGGMEMDLLYNIVLAQEPERIIETGIAYGWSSLALLAGLNELRRGQLWSSNLAYQEMDCEEDVGCAVPLEWRERWHIARGPDSDVLPEICRQVGSCQMVVYDSDKLYTGRRRSYNMLWRVLDVGGIFVSDDISDNMGFFHFARTVKTKPVIVVHRAEGEAPKYLGVLQKSDTSPPRDVWF